METRNDGIAVVEAFVGIRDRLRKIAQEYGDRAEGQE